MKILTSTLLFLTLTTICFAQNKFPTTPEEAQLITSDLDLFWEAYDQLENDPKALQTYITNGSTGVQDFIKYRIQSAEHLTKTVLNNKTRYENARAGSSSIPQYKEEILAAFRKLKTLYPDAVFAPTYFVIGALNSGGTASANGLMIGIDMFGENRIPFDDLPDMVAHESIHFNQHYTDPKQNLLYQSLIEGSADFFAELMTGNHINQAAHQYGEANEEMLCREFVKIRKKKKYKGWLYGSRGKKAGRPNDLGYWMGYKICKAYYDKSTDKAAALHTILNIEDCEAFLRDSGYLEDYL